MWVRGPSLWPLWIPVGDCASQVCHLVLDKRRQLLPGEGILPVPRCFRDDEEPGEEVVEEEVRGGGGRAPRHGLDPFLSLPVQRVGELVRQGVGRFEGAVGGPWVTEGEDIRVR